VQGLAARFVESVEGSYSNVVGLPVESAQRLLAAEGVVEAPLEGQGRPDAARAV